MQTKKLSLANLQSKMSRNEMKNIMAGDAPGEGCGTGISCEGKTEYESCGSKNICSCVTVPGGGTNIYYCRSDA